MRDIRCIIIMLFVGLLTGCGNGNKKSENVTKQLLTGRWQPEKITFRDVPAIIKMQIPADFEEKLLNDAQKAGYVELNADGNFKIKITRQSEEYTGKWRFDGENGIEIESDKLISENDNMRFVIDIVDLSEDSLEIDLASVYKMFGSLNEIPFLGVKMIITYKRVV